MARQKSTRRRILIGLGFACLVFVLLYPVYGNIVTRARNAKATADTRALANAVIVYRSHMGRLPAALDELMQPATNRSGETLTPMLHTLPTAPVGFAPYRYEKRADGTFRVTTSHEKFVVKAP